MSHRVGRLRFALTVGAGWEHFDLPGGTLAGGCHYFRNQRTGPSSADVAAVVAAAPGTDLISAPSEVTVGGYPTQHVALAVREDVGCDPGFFFTYPNVYGGALWPETVPGDTIRVWIVEVASDLLFIVSGTKPDAGAALEQDVDDIVQSIVFEQD